VRELVAQYEKFQEDLMRDLMRLSILSEMPYDTVTDMTYQERRLLGEVIKEKIDAQTPNKQRQQYL
jgi:hypothetical protein